MSDQLPLLTLPEDNLPDGWNDETRLNVLFAPFRSKSVNPQDWNSKYSFWKNLICQCCIHSQVYTFKVDDLQKLFHKNGRSPGCLNIVINEMHKNGDIKPIDKFLQQPPQTWGKWATDVFIKTPIVWSYSKVKDSLVSSTVDHTYVHLQAVQTGAETLLLSVPEEFRNKVISLQELLEILKIDLQKTPGIKLLLHYLTCTGKADTKEIQSKNKQEDSSQLLIKLGDIKKINPICDTDISVYILEQNEKTLTKELEKLENEVSLTINEAKSHLSKGHRQLAKNSLRKKHEIENRVTKRVNALHNVQVLLVRIRDSSSDAQVLESYNLALSTLRSEFKETGLSEDAVADTMTDLGEVLDIHTDIQEALAQPITEIDADLEEELAELIADDNNSAPPNLPSPSKKNIDIKDVEKMLENLDLPEVPAESPTVIKRKVSL